MRTDRMHCGWSCRHRWLQMASEDMTQEHHHGQDPMNQALLCHYDTIFNTMSDTQRKQCHKPSPFSDISVLDITQSSSASAMRVISCTRSASGYTQRIITVNHTPCQGESTRCRDMHALKHASSEEDRMSRRDHSVDYCPCLSTSRWRTSCGAWSSSK